MFTDPDLKSLQIDIAVDLFRRDKDDIRKVSKKSYKRLEFSRNLSTDLFVSQETLSIDIAQCAAVFAYYTSALADFKRCLSRIDSEIKVLKGKLGVDCRMDLLNNPDIPSERVTDGFVNAFVDSVPSMRIFQRMRDEVQDAVTQLEFAVQSIQMKSFHMQTMAKNLSHEFMMSDAHVKREPKRT